MSVHHLPNVKRSSKSSRNRRRFANKHEKELHYQELFPPYVPVHNYAIFFINNLTSNEDLQYLIDVARQTRDFIIDTESDYISHLPALIQIFFMNAVHEQSPFLIIETNFLPSCSSKLFLQLRELFEYIFRDAAHLYAWGSLSHELTPFLQYQLFSLPVVSFIHNSQTTFKDWFNDWLNFTQSSLTESSLIDSADSIIIHAPAIDPTLFIPPSMMNDIKLRQQELWSIQDAVAYVCHKYLSKRETLNTWSFGLDTRLDVDNLLSHKERQRRIIYAVYDCLSLAELVLFMYKSLIPSAWVCVKYFNPTGKYVFYSDTNCLSVSIENNPMNLAIDYNEPCVHSVTVHDSYERHPITTEVIEDNSQSHQQINPAATAAVTSRQPHKRSSTARTKRNQKSSLRHRRNRYQHELIRSANVPITEAKRILRYYNIKYTNLNIVRSMIYVGVKSEECQRYYEQMLAMDVFHQPLVAGEVLGSPSI